MIQLDAPILPGERAAGIRVGEPIARLLEAHQPEAHVPLQEGRERFHFGPVWVWAENGRITQVGVSRGYSGRLAGRIGIGSTVRDVERLIGPIGEDDEDNLVVVGSPGWCFETEPWRPGTALEDNRDARLSWIFVFAEPANDAPERPGAGSVDAR